MIDRELYKSVGQDATHALVDVAKRKSADVACTLVRKVVRDKLRAAGGPVLPKI
jgi:hypothetical protein